MLKYIKKGDSEPMNDSFKIKNSLQVGKSAYIDGDLFVSGNIISAAPINLDCGTPTESEILGVYNDR